MKWIGGMLILLMQITWACPSYVVNWHLVSDINLDCIFPITIGSITAGGSVNLPDTDNGANPFCLCHTGLVPQLGLRTSYWEPMAIVEVTRTPGCFSNFGGLQCSLGSRGRGGIDQLDNTLSSGFYDVHYYAYPI